MNAAFLARDVNPELVFWRSIVAPIALVGDEPIDGRADLMLDIGDDAFQRVAVVGISRKRLRVRNELATPGMVERRGETFTPNSKGLCDLPLAMHSISGACRKTPAAAMTFSILMIFVQN